MRKDYWNISKRNFRAMAVVAALVIIIYEFITAGGNIPSSVMATLMYTVTFFVISFIVFIIAAILFKRHSSKAIALGYTYTALAFIYVIITNFIMSSPMDGTIYKVGGLIVLAYLFYGIYKASKQTATTQ